jgi:hypothetical protein
MAHPSFVDYGRQLGLNKSVIWIVKPGRIPMSEMKEKEEYCNRVIFLPDEDTRLEQPVLSSA